MTLRLTDEQRLALQANPDKPLSGEVEDWDIESIKEEGRQILKEGPPKTS